MTINFDALIEKVVRYEQGSILSKWGRAAGDFHLATGLPAPVIGPDAEAEAREAAEQIVTDRLMRALHGR